MTQEQYERAAEIVALQRDKKEVLRLRDRIPLELFYGHPIVKQFTHIVIGRDAFDSMRESCVKIFDTYIAEIDNRIAELEKGFEGL